MDLFDFCQFLLLERCLNPHLKIKFLTSFHTYWNQNFTFADSSSVKILHQFIKYTAQVTVNGLLQNPIVANKILYTYTLHKALENASALFRGFSKPDPVSWSVMVGGYAKAGDFMNCFRTFREYIRSGVGPDNYTLPCVIRVCRDTKDLQMGRSIHNVVYKFGLISDPFSTAALVDMYAKCKVINDATQLFDGMPKRDLVRLDCDDRGVY
ncbi:Pentatricopeptide repeat-containing protein [Forsythia ovata]|uniref:Pentatricopeptide repeat-containing protein n=1 Tax=Forsythia ovata TaxID=205694 RepID=A0ABD1SRS1_9LAMI